MFVQHAGLHVYNMDTLYTAPRAGLGTKPSPFSSSSSSPHHSGCIQKTILFLSTPALFFGIGGVGLGGPGIVRVSPHLPPSGVLLVSSVVVRVFMSVFVPTVDRML